MISRSTVILLVALAGTVAFGESETVGTYTYHYVVTNGAARIFADRACAISPKPEGAVEIPSTLGGHPVTIIGAGAFSLIDGSPGISIEDSSVPVFGRRTISSARKGLTAVTIPPSVTTIEECAFSMSDDLASVVVPDSVCTIGDEAFFRCEALTAVRIPAGITTIGRKTFSGCYKLSSLTLPDSVTRIKEDAFSCSGLSVIEIPNSVTTIGDKAFYGCSDLRSVAIPDSVTTIGNEAFEDCRRLASVTLGRNVRTIGKRAFGDRLVVRHPGRMKGVMIVPNAVQDLLAVLVGFSIPFFVMSCFSQALQFAMSALIAVQRRTIVKIGYISASLLLCVLAFAASYLAIKALSHFPSHDARKFGDLFVAIGSFLQLFGLRKLPKLWKRISMRYDIAAGMR